MGGSACCGAVRREVSEVKAGDAAAARGNPSTYLEGDYYE